MKRALKPSTTTGGKKTRFAWDEETELIPGVRRAASSIATMYTSARANVGTSRD